MIAKYKDVGPELDDDILRQAEDFVKPQWDIRSNPNAPRYSIWPWKSHQCQDYADEVMDVYEQLLFTKLW